MILKREIEKIAEQKKVAKTTIDKDWVLGHFTDAIFSIPECRQSLVFKTINTNFCTACFTKNGTIDRCNIMKA